VISVADAIKDFYNREYLSRLAQNINGVYPAFKAEDFLNAVLDHTWDGLEFKERMRHITLNLGKFLPQKYPEALAVIDATLSNYKSDGGWSEGGVMFFPDFVEVYGQGEEFWDLSMAALARYTPYASAEFAVRPFIINHEERMMAQMTAWAGDDCEHLRRLASEGCRPALPWAQALPKFKKDPAPVLPILEKLKNDPSLYVRRSVANNLNDIAKTHPGLVAEIAKKWHGDNPDTDWLVKHACRTLLKRGHPAVMELFGFHDANAVDVTDFVLSAGEVAIGESLGFSFNVHTKKDTKVRLEFGIDFVKANGKNSRKIFQISEISMKKNQSKTYSKTQSFKDLSTRKHYAGLHSITIIVNGAERGTLEFNVTKYDDEVKL